jgi:hypothetical protein
LACLREKRPPMRTSDVIYRGALAREALFGTRYHIGYGKFVDVRDIKARALDIRGTVDDLLEEEATDWYFCGPDLKAEPECRDGYTADLLCDYPMGDGKTCDAPLCEDCAHHVGRDLDLCELHFHEWSGKARLEAIPPQPRPWPPRKED